MMRVLTVLDRTRAGRNPLGRVVGMIGGVLTSNGLQGETAPFARTVTRVIDALLLEQNEELAVQRARYMTLATIVPPSDTPATSLLLWQPDRATDAAQDRRSNTTRWDTTERKRLWCQHYRCELKAGPATGAQQNREPVWSATNLKCMVKSLLPNDLWALVAPPPREPPRPEGGRPPVPNRTGLR